MLSYHIPFPATLSNMDQLSPSPHLFVARDEELARMHGFIDQALMGKGSVALEYAKKAIKNGMHISDIPVHQ
jgi:hypothetical protein